jgi:hypothetical protein
MLFSNVGGLATKALIAASIITSSTAASAAACQAGPGGCVLPIADAPPPAPFSSAPPAAPLEAAPVAEAAGGGIGLVAILGAIAALGLIYFLFIDDDDNDTVPLSPG